MSLESILQLALVAFVLLLCCSFTEADYEYHYQETINGVDYYVISNCEDGAGVEYATLEEVECFFETGIFNYFTSCMDCYNNAIFVKLDLDKSEKDCNLEVWD